MAITKEQVLEALSNVEEPDLKKDLVTLNMIQDIHIDGNKLSFSVGTHRNLAQLLVVPTDVSTQRVDTSSALEVIDSLAVSISTRWEETEVAIV